MNNQSLERDPRAFLDLSTQMGRQVAAHDWASTSLGPIEIWPSALKIAVGLVLRSGFAKCLCWGPEHLAIYNDAFVPILGDKGNCLGQPCSIMWQDAWDKIGPMTAKAIVGSATFLRDFRVTLDRGEEGPEEAFFTFSYSPIVDEHGCIKGFMHTVMETTERVKFERKAAVSNRELVHRMKNSYALISAIVGQIARTSETKDELRRKLMERLGTMGQAQEILSLRNRSQATVADVANHILSRLDDKGRRFWAKGPEILLNDEETFALSLALNELATNSIKYGALSADDGQVFVDWQLNDAEDNASFLFRWREEGGPLVAPPSRKGFGTFLIKRLLAAEFGGVVELDYAPGGLSCVLKSHRTLAKPA
ncbi:sensor histidine kinase [Paracoccus yeei]|uniref:sensor histidine kinase n=1 Tax=Paracoccus yeei TaxID=147645 RepID=UPI003BF8CDBC